MLPERQSGLSVVGRFAYLHQADLARALLESEGVEAWLLDEHQVRQRWHLGGALGGVKVAVAPQDAARAQALLSEDFSPSLSGIPEQELAAHPEEMCPRCGAAAAVESSIQRLPGPVQWMVSLFFLFFGLLVPQRRFTVRRECGGCGHSWSRQERR